MRAAALLTLAFLGACSSQPRAVSYFRAHLGEAANVSADCVRGVRRGPECADADQAIALYEAAARMAWYRKGF
jgi:hypothetical protein